MTMINRNDYRTSSEAEASERKVCSIWVNVGKKRIVNGKETLVTLPMGIPLETMQPAKGAFSADKNKLRNYLLQIASQMQEGEHKELHLTIELVKASNQNPQPEESDDWLDDII